MKGSRGKIWQESTKQEGKIEHLVSGLAGLGCLLDWTVGGLVGFVVLLFCWCLLPLLLVSLVSWFVSFNLKSSLHSRICCQSAARMGQLGNIGLRGVQFFSPTQAQVVEDVVEFMETLTTCLGMAIEFASTGYDYEIVPGGVSMSIGLSTGARAALEDLISGRPPSAFISLDFGFAVGITKKLAWLGTGLGGSLVCDSGAGCDAYITVAAIGSVNVPTASAFCPMGVQWGPATCANSLGGGLATMCCSMDLDSGDNDCR